MRYERSYNVERSKKKKKIREHRLKAKLDNLIYDNQIFLEKFNFKILWITVDDCEYEIRLINLISLIGVNKKNK